MLILKPVKRIHQIALWQKLATFVHKGTDSEYFRLCGAAISLSYSTLWRPRVKAATGEGAWLHCIKPLRVKPGRGQNWAFRHQSAFEPLPCGTLAFYMTILSYFFIFGYLNIVLYSYTVIKIKFVSVI